MTIAIGFLAVMINTFCPKYLPLLESIFLVINIIDFFAILIPLWILAPMVPAREGFLNFANYGGWSSVGAACVIGQVSAGGSLIGADAAVHMAEEVRSASLTVPWMILGTILLSRVMGSGIITTYVFVIQNVQTQILNSTFVYPFIEVWEVAIGSRAGAVGMTVPLVRTWTLSEIPRATFDIDFMPHRSYFKSP